MDPPPRQPAAWRDKSQFRLFDSNWQPEIRAAFAFFAASRERGFLQRFAGVFAHTIDLPVVDAEDAGLANPSLAFILQEFLDSMVLPIGNIAPGF
jgi:hypothetical protein